MNHLLNCTNKSAGIACYPASNRSAIPCSRLKLGLLLLAGLLSLLLAGSVQAGKPSTPAAPSGLGASAVASTQINLAWLDNSSNESGFIVQRAPSSGGPWTQIGTTAPDVRSYASTGLSAGG